MLFFTGSSESDAVGICRTLKFAQGTNEASLGFRVLAYLCDTAAMHRTVSMTLSDAQATCRQKLVCSD